jgi:hypothetical protein
MNKILTITAILMTAIFTSGVLATGTTTLDLCAKDTSWACTGTKTATLTFDTVGPTFKGTLTTHNLQNIDYALIYYPDKTDRFASDKWNGAGGKVITTWTGDANGPFNTDLGINLPNTDDWNAVASPDYCDLRNTWDDYAHCRGAKIWIVPTTDLTSNTDLPLDAWTPSSYLFETDLITYVDSDLPTTGTMGTEVVVPDPTCGISASGIGDFGTMTRGQTKGSDYSIYSTVTTSGDSAATIYLYGSNWNYNTEADGFGMDVSQTSWNLDIVNWYSLKLAAQKDNLGTYSSGNTIYPYFKLTIPSVVPAGDFVQTITFTGTC